MARYEFKFVVTDTQLSDEHQQKVGRAVAEAGALAVASVTPPDAVTVRYALNHWWCGLPPVEIRDALEAVATRRATEDVGREAI
jgi:hypothetical protein